MPAASIDQPPTPSQKRSARSTSCAGNSTCTTFFAIGPPLADEAIRSGSRARGGTVVKAVVLWEQAPDSDWYARHGELCKQVPGATFRAGRVFGTPTGESEYAQYAEFEFPDEDAFNRGM